MTANCPSGAWPANEEWLKAFRQKATDNHIPVSGMIELTRACNLRCVHCYIDSRSRTACAAREMSTENVRNLRDEIVEAGCLYLTLTGGDPMMRGDFEELYVYARSRGLVVTVFCNGTLISETIADAFQAYPPRAVEVTLYGATAEVHDSITGTAGSFKAVLEGVGRLQAEDVVVGLKTVVMKPNAGELAGLEALADKLGVPFRLDPAVFDRCDGESLPLEDLRVDAIKAVELEFSNESRLSQWQEYAASRKGFGETDRLYSCGGGTTGFFVGAYGSLSPCLLAVQYRRNILEKRFDAAWRSLHEEVTSQKSSSDYPCTTCESKVACTGCAAMNYIENGSEEIICEYVCEIAKQRHAMLVSRGKKHVAGVRS